MAEVTGKTDFQDPTPIPAKQTYTPDNINSIALEMAKFLRTKMYGADVRESLARWVEITQAVLRFYDTDAKQFKTDLTQLQGQVTKRQTSVESQFVSVLANATQDSEVINARDSNIYGPFGVLDLRLENIEQMLAMAIPAGFTVTINHGLGRNPTVTVVYYEYALGTEPNGLGSGPAGTFGGTPPKTLQSTVSYVDANTVKIDLPAGFKLSGVPVYQPIDGRWYLIDGYRTIRFDLGVTADDNPNTGEQSQL